MRKLVKRASDYHDLSAEEHKHLVIAFDEEKEAAHHRPPNLSIKTHNAECSNSFKAIVNEVGHVSFFNSYFHLIIFRSKL